MGIWGLGLDWLGYGGNGLYGLDLLESHGTDGDTLFSMQSTLTAAINTTDYFLGFFGLGITQASFGDVVAKSPLTQAVEAYGLIPSYTYGYTAGAHYRNVPTSLTLGGYDAARFADHGDKFVLGTDDNFPYMSVRGIEMERAAVDTSRGWIDSPIIISDNNTAFTALIDTSTPFLWLPDHVCDSIAVGLEITYNSTLDLYTLTNEQYQRYGAEDGPNFVFSFSSRDNNDDFGDPLNVPGVVNITIPSRALVSTLQYPFKNEAIAYGDPAVPYFSVRRYGNDSSSFIFGRSFLQEAYLLTQYDKGTFSIHQARFPKNLDTDINIMTVEQPSNSPYPPPNPPRQRSLSPGQLGGIVAGSVIAVFVIAAGCWMWRRKKKRQQNEQTMSGGILEKTSSSSTSSRNTQQRRSPITRLFMRMVGRETSRRRNSTSQKHAAPSEVPNHEIFELPAPVPPAELNGDSEDGENENDLVYDSRHMSTYEQTRLRMDRQLAGPVPEYSPPISGEAPPPEKSVYDHEPRNLDRPKSNLPPLPIPQSNPSNPNEDSGPSPISPQFGFSPRLGEEPSPMTATAPHFPRFGTTGQQLTRSMSWGRSLAPTSTNQSRSDDSISPITPSRIALPPSSRFQRTPIDPSNVVYLGALPEQAQDSSRPPTPEILHPDGRPVASSGSYPSEGTDGDSFNSSFMDEEEEEALRQIREREEQRAAVFAAIRDTHVERSHDTGGSTVDSHRRWSLQTEHFERSNNLPGGRSQFGLGMELVHVPQLPDRRYSWEED